MIYTTLLLTIIFTLTRSTLAQETNVSSSLSSVDCPSPFIVRNPNGLIKDNNQICLKNCCLACPFADNFYEENKIENVYQSFAVLGVISFFLMILLGIFFVKLPSQRQNPLAKQILLPLALSVAYFEGSEFFTLNQKQSQCVDPITSADPSNNSYCTAQAIFTLGGGYAISCYSALLIIHLHLISVWRTEFITKNIKYFHIAIIGSSVAAIIIPFATHNVQSTNICFISLEKSASYFYFLCFIYIAFVAHLATIIYMAHITVKSSSSISSVSRRTSIIEAQRKLSYLKAIFKIQWRAFLGSSLMLVVYVLNWHYYVFNIPTYTSSILAAPWVKDWIACLNNNGNQNMCASKISDHIPNYYYIFILLFFNSTAGILIFLIFAAKKMVLMELYDIIRGKKLRSHPNLHVSYFETDSVRYSLRSIRNSISRSSMIFKQNKEGNGTTLAGTSNRESATSKMEVKDLNEVTRPSKLVPISSRRDSKMNPSPISSMGGLGHYSSPNDDFDIIYIKENENET